MKTKRTWRVVTRAGVDTGQTLQASLEWCVAECARLFDTTVFEVAATEITPIERGYTVVVIAYCDTEE